MYNCTKFLEFSALGLCKAILANAKLLYSALWVTMFDIWVQVGAVESARHVSPVKQAATVKAIVQQPAAPVQLAERPLAISRPATAQQDHTSYYLQVGRLKSLTLNPQAASTYRTSLMMHNSMNSSTFLFLFPAESYNPFSKDMTPCANYLTDTYGMDQAMTNIMHNDMRSWH